MGMEGQRSSPYVGPRAFVAGEPLYGREREIADLVDLVIAERVVLLYAPSGAGKSSLLQAGLTPRLVAEDFVVRPVARVGMPPPPGVTANRFVLSVLLSLEEDVPEDRQVPVAALAERSLAGYLDERMRREGAGSEVLILDQFEEVLTTDPTARAAQLAFFAALGTALRDPRRHAVIAMREDFIAGLDPFKAAIPTRLRATYRLDLLQEAAARAAIQAPSRAAGVEFSDAAAHKLVDDLRRIQVQEADGATVMRPGAFVEPVHLQVVCRSLWARLPADARRIDEADLAGLGDVDQALAAYYSDQVTAAAQACAVPERMLRGWIERTLVTPDGLRSQVLRTAGATLGLANAVLDELVDTHLLRADARRGVMWIELGHDRLVGPLRASNARWAQEHLGMFERQAELWDLQGRPDRLLLVDQVALARVVLGGEQQTAVEQAFLEHSKAAIRRMRRAWIASVSMKVFAGLAAIGLVVAVVASLRARAREAEARAAEERARRWAAEADSERARAVAQETLAMARMLGAESQLLPRSEYELVALLTVVAGKLAPEEARGLLLGLQHRWPRFRGMLAGGWSQPSPTKSELLMAGAAGSGGSRLVDLERRDRLVEVSPGRLDDAAFSADGRRVALVAGDLFTVVDVAANEQVWRGNGLRLAGPHPFAPDGRRIAAVDEQGRVVVVGLPDGATVARSPEPIAGGVVAMQLGADALTLVDGAGVVSRFSVPEWRPRAYTRSLRAPSGAVSAAAFSPDGKRVALARRREQFAELQVFALDDGGDPRSLTSRRGAQIQAMAWSASGSLLAVAYCAGLGCHMATVEVWSAADELLFTLQMTDQIPMRVGFVGERQLVVGTATSTLLFDARPNEAVPGAPTAAAVSPDGTTLAVADREAVVLLAVDLEQIGRGAPRELARLPGPVMTRGLQFSGDGRQLWATSHRREVAVIDIAGEKIVGTTPAPAGVEGVALAGQADGRLFAAGWREAGIFVWDARTGEEVRALTPEARGSSALAWSPDGSTLASAGCLAGCGSSRVQLWRPAQGGAPVAALAEVPGGLTALEFAPDGASLIGASWQHLARWALPGGQVATYGMDDTKVSDLVFAGDGSAFLAVGTQQSRCLEGPCDMGVLHLFAGASLRAIGPTMRTMFPRLDVPAIGRAGEFAVVLRPDAGGRADGELWRLDVAALVEEACALAGGREPTDAEWRRYLGDRARFAVCGSTERPSETRRVASKPPRGQRKVADTPVADTPKGEPPAGESLEPSRVEAPVKAPREDPTLRPIAEPPKKRPPGEQKHRPVANPAPEVEPLDPFNLDGPTKKPMKPAEPAEPSEAPGPDGPAEAPGPDGPAP
jgi:WD40 repeat protein